MKALCITFITLTSLLLLAYPFVLMANVMTLANLPSAEPLPTATSLSIHGFMWGSTLYPIPYLAALAGSIWHLRKGRPKIALFWQAGLLCYLVLVITLLFSPWT